MSAEQLKGHLDSLILAVLGVVLVLGSVVAIIQEQTALQHA